MEKESQPFWKEHSVKWRGETFRIRAVTHLPDELTDKQFAELLNMQMADQIRLLWMAIGSLGSDLYARLPHGPSEFKDLMNETKLVVVSNDGNPIDLAADLP